MSFVRRYWAPFLFFGLLYWAFTALGEAGAAVKGLLVFLLEVARDFVKVLFDLASDLDNGSGGVVRALRSRS